jgi:hypothetical protein
MPASLPRQRHTGPTLALALALVLVIAACATTRQRRSVETRGFLGDYSLLREGTGDEPQLYYVRPGSDFSRYDRVLIESVTFWYEGEAKLSAQDQQRLTDQLYLSLDTKLREKGFAIVKQPGPGVLRLRAAITEARGAKTVANTVTSVVPQTAVVTTLGGLATDAANLVGQAAIEAELSDSLSGQRLMAAVDERVGTKSPLGAFSKWKHVTDAFDYWAGRIAEDLDSRRSGAG